MNEIKVTELVNCPTFYYHPQKIAFSFIRITALNIIKNNVKSLKFVQLDPPEADFGGGLWNCFSFL